MPVRIIATSFAFVAFAAALLCGLAARNPAGTIISRAMVAMIVCYIVGLIIGTIGRYAIQEHVDEYKRKHPVRPDEADADEEVIDEDDLVDRTASQNNAASGAAKTAAT